MLASEEVAHGATEAGHHGADAHHGPGIWGLWVYMALAFGIVLVTMGIAKNGLNKRFFTNKLTKYYEQIYVFVENLCVGIIGSHGKKYMPFIMTLWVVILISNALALFAPTSATADLSFNLGMAIIAVMYVQYEGMKANGIFGHFKHFAGPIMPGILIAINFFIFPIELVSETMKMVSLSLRLFGNIDGGHKAVVAMNELGEKFYLPFGTMLMPIKLLTVVVQALIFCLLTCVYLSLVTHHEDHGHDEHGEPTEAKPVTA